MREKQKQKAREEWEKVINKPRKKESFRFNRHSNRYRLDMMGKMSSKGDSQSNRQINIFSKRFLPHENNSKVYVAKPSIILNGTKDNVISSPTTSAVIWKFGSPLSSRISSARRKLSNDRLTIQKMSDSKNNIISNHNLMIEVKNELPLSSPLSVMRNNLSNDILTTCSFRRDSKNSIVYKMNEDDTIQQHLNMSNNVFMNNSYGGLTTKGSVDVNDSRRSMDHILEDNLKDQQMPESIISNDKNQIVVINNPDLVCYDNHNHIIDNDNSNSSLTRTSISLFTSNNEVYNNTNNMQQFGNRLNDVLNTLLEGFVAGDSSNIYDSIEVRNSGRVASRRVQLSHKANDTEKLSSPRVTKQIEMIDLEIPPRPYNWFGTVSNGVHDNGCSKDNSYRNNGGVFNGLEMDILYNQDHTLTINIDSEHLNEESIIEKNSSCSPSNTCLKDDITLDNTSPVVFIDEVGSLQFEVKDLKSTIPINLFEKSNDIVIEKSNDHKYVDV